jgi:deoxyribodipyrimidine photolyase-related protein
MSPAKRSKANIRNLVLVLGDQLNRDSSAFQDFDPSKDVVWMAEVDEESTHVWTHKVRIAYFSSAMRHFRDRLRNEGFVVEYQELPGSAHSTLDTAIREASQRLSPERWILTQPGEWRVLQTMQNAAAECGIEMEVRTDQHFVCSDKAFRRHAEGRTSLRMEFFYGK